MSVLYENTNQPAWSITKMMTRHHPDCQVRESLRQTVGKDGWERLRAAQSTPCNCGSAERHGTPRFDAYLEHLNNRRKEQEEQSWQESNREAAGRSSTPNPTKPSAG